MRVNKELCRKYTEQLAYHRDVVPVFRIRERALAEMEADALHLASGVAGRSPDTERPDLRRQKGVSSLTIGEGVQARVFHSSGAIAIKSGLAPFEALIADDAESVENAMLVQTAKRQAYRIDPHRWAGAGERLEFERLWQIKASGMTEKLERGRVALCRIVAAFRRYAVRPPGLGSCLGIRAGRRRRPD